MSKPIPSRYASRSTNDLADILQVLDKTSFCTISYSKHNRPYALPTGFCLVNNQIVIHGSAKSHFLDELINTKEVCVSTFIFDGLVLATSAFEHSVNYRSVNIFGQAEELVESNQKLNALKVFTDKYIPGRWNKLRPVTAGELKATRVLTLSIEKASLKQRNGPPMVKDDEWAKQIWTGVIPAKMHYLKPIQSEEQQTMEELPEHIQHLINCRDDNDK